MALVDQLLAQPERKTKCRIGVYLHRLDEPQRREVLDAFAELRIEHGILAQHLTGVTGTNIDSTNVGRHRRRQCGACNTAGFF